MVSRPNAKLVREVAHSKNLALAEKKRKALAKQNLIKKGWCKQINAIINSAVDGRFEYETTEIYKGELLIDLGFTLHEVHSSFKEKDLSRFSSIEALFDHVINKNIDQFLLVSEGYFKNPSAYRSYVLEAIDKFINRAHRIKDTKDKFALLNFLNSEFYTAFGADGGFNAHTDILVRLNNSIDFVVSDDRPLLKTNSEIMKYITKLLPLSEFKIERLRSDLLKIKDDIGFFRISWRYTEGLKNKEGELSANIMSWLSGSAGQRLMDFIYKCIDKAHGNSIVLSYENSLLSFKRGGQVKMLSFSLDNLKEVMTAKGFKTSLSDNEIIISW